MDTGTQAANPQLVAGFFLDLSWRFARIPAKRSRHSGYCDTMESGVVRRQVRQIVQSQLNLGDFLP